MVPYLQLLPHDTEFYRGRLIAVTTGPEVNEVDKLNESQVKITLPMRKQAFPLPHSLAQWTDDFPYEVRGRVTYTREFHSTIFHGNEKLRIRNPGTVQDPNSKMKNSCNLDRTNPRSGLKSAMTRE